MSTASDWQDHYEVGRKIIKRESALSAADAAAASADDGRMMARRSCSTPAAAAGAGPGSAAVNTITPCAACKLLRRRCAQECPFSPYFSPLEPHKFASVHKVFGASNVSKMLLEVHESQRGDAANSLVYEANLRLRDPVYGCMGAILNLQQQVHALESELAAVRAQIVSHKYRSSPATATTVLPSSHASQLLAGRLPVAAAGTMGVTTATLPAVASASSSTTTAAVYAAAAASSSTDYSSITNENVPYFS
uniref:LOB domain-containing protein n=1 Tax=Leersia perrieri TaxID=77586 RepID=A0A0D9WD76_9ORYZ